MPTLRELRIERLWTQRELAKRAGVSHGTIVSAETGQRLPRLLTMKRIADALGADWAEVGEFREAVEEAKRGNAAQALARRRGAPER